MPDKEENLTPVDVKASVPLEIKVSDESIKDIGDSVKSPPTLKSIADSAEPTPVLIAAEQPPVPVTIEASANTPLTVTASEPLPVVVQSAYNPPPPQRPDVVKGEGITLAPTTTEQDDLVTEGQRHINLIWETTQSRIALLVVSAGVFLNSVLVVLIVFSNREVSITQLSLISISLQFINLTVGIVIGFYFSRTNHTKTGGVGQRPQDESYTGR